MKELRSFYRGRLQLFFKIVFHDKMIIDFKLTIGIIMGFRSLGEKGQN